MNKLTPPPFFTRFFRWFCHQELLASIEGDLMELYSERLNKFGKRNADLRFIWDVMLLFRPGIIKPIGGFQQVNNYGMLKSNLKIGWRNIHKNKVYSIINIGGLTVGISVAILIGLWINDELSFDQYHENYNHIARVMQNTTSNGGTATLKAMPIPVATELRNTYGTDFKYVILSSWTNPHIISFNDKFIIAQGNFMDADAPKMLTLKMKVGSNEGLKAPGGMLISESIAKSIFGSDDPLDKILQLDNNNLKVAGVYEDLPSSTSFNNVSFIAPWSLFSKNDDVRAGVDNWGQNSYQIFVQTSDKAEMKLISSKIKNIKLDKISKEEGQQLKPEIFLFPMPRWHLYSEFKNGLNTGGSIQYVWLFGIIGATVLLLACINFMNLSTARSSKRAKEVGIRKTMGSVRWQLINQFFTESFLTVTFAFALSLLLILFILPSFNEFADKQINFLWASPMLWLGGAAFILITGGIAGSYPAFYLSSFQPINTLKGIFFTGRLASTLRKVLVVLQFTASLVLIIGTIIIFEQVQFAQSRPAGYNSEGLIMVRTYSNEFHKHFDALRNDLLMAHVISDIAESGNQITRGSRSSGDFEWPGKNPNNAVDFATFAVSSYYGKTVGWQFKAGLDFSNSYSLDSSNLVLNQSAVEYMGLRNPIGTIITWNNIDFKIIGVINNLVVESPYEPVKPTVFYLTPGAGLLNIRLNPDIDPILALEKIKKVCQKYFPSDPFDYQFASQEYAKKFSQENRIGNLGVLFATLAIFISCLGIFGLASYVAEQRTKEIGLRKVMGASVLSLWKMLSKDFALLVVIALFLAIPIAYYIMDNWLNKYNYRIEISWWAFAAASIGALILTLLTVSYQTIRAALANPVNSLRPE